MLEKFRHYRERIKEGMLRDMWRQTLWIYEYARIYWKQMIFYTVLGLAAEWESLTGKKMFTLSALPSMHRRMSSMHCRERSDGWRESRQRPSIPMYKRLRNGDLYDTRGKNHRAPEDGEDAVGG